jgi:hypothetical protein
MKIVEQERKKNYRLSRADVFRHRCRYFSDSGIIGSKEFVGEVFDGVKHLLASKDERRFTPVGRGGGDVFDEKTEADRGLTEVVVDMIMIAMQSVGGYPWRP